MKVVFLESEIADTSGLPADFCDRYTKLVESAHREVKLLLPYMSDKINYIVQPRTYQLMDEGDNGHTHNSELVELAFDPSRDAKDLELILSRVRPTVFHEGHHAARYHLGLFHNSFLENAVMEGLATVFERDCAGVPEPYGEYPEEVKDWIEEIITLQDQFNWGDYSFNHPDGRRWIVYKVGTYLVDQAMKQANRNVLGLSALEAKEIIKMSGVNVDGYTGFQE